MLLLNNLNDAGLASLSIWEIQDGRPNQFSPVACNCMHFFCNNLLYSDFFMLELTFD